MQRIYVVLSINEVKIMLDI